MTKTMHDAALHFWQKREQYGLSEATAYDIEQVAESYVGVGDEAAAQRGIVHMRALYQKLGKRAPF